MEKRSTKIWFLTWPDGKLFEKTQTSVGEKMAWALAVRTWLPEKFFPGIEIINSYSMLNELCRSMQKAGFTCHELDVSDVAKGVSV